MVSWQIRLMVQLLINQLSYVPHPDESLLNRSDAELADTLSLGGVEFLVTRFGQDQTNATVIFISFFWGSPLDRIPEWNH